MMLRKFFQPVLYPSAFRANNTPAILVALPFRYWGISGVLRLPQFGVCTRIPPNFRHPIGRSDPLSATDKIPESGLSEKEAGGH